MNNVELYIKKIAALIKEDKQKNSFATGQVLDSNIHRIHIAGFITILVHILHVVFFYYHFVPATHIELIWQKAVIAVHGVNVVIMLLITISTYFLRKEKGYVFLKKFIQLFYTVDILTIGIALVTVDQHATTNITPFLVICTVIGVLILKRPAAAIGIYISIYLIFYHTIGLYQTEAAILMTNRVNGITATSIGIGISFIMWYTHRTNIHQNIKIEEQKLELEKLAFYDTLTGLYNRRKWLSILTDEAKDTNEADCESSIILLDIDYFKDINDKFGHPVGDKVLHQVAGILKKQLRASDKVARWGGEEFIILLPQTPLVHAFSVAETLRSTIEQELMVMENHRVSITASFGVSYLNEKEEFLKSYSKADKSLYLAKQKGRNCVQCVELDHQACL